MLGRLLLRGYATWPKSISKILADGVVSTGSENLTVEGWVKAVRHLSKHTLFLNLSDGLSNQHLQIVISDPKIIERHIPHGSAVSVKGKLVESAGSGQSIELLAESVTIKGPMDISSFPIKPKKRYTADQLRLMPELRSKTNSFAAYLRIRSAAVSIIHQLLQKEEYVFVDTPVITTSDCEGAGEVFSIQPQPSTSSSAVSEDNELKHFFSKQAHLTVSGQLHLEAIAGGISRVYSLGPIFRAEKSHTRQHLAEFYMLELELAFVDHVDTLMKVVEKLIQEVAGSLLDRCTKDVELVAKFYQPQLKWDMLPIHKLASDKQYTKITFDEAIDRLRSDKESDFRFEPSYEQGLSKEHERRLVQMNGGLPIFVTHFPTEQKPFYMKRSTNDKTAECFDLLAPDVCEICGGSLRENNLDKLKLRVEENDLHKSFKWYIDLRRFGYAPLGGFGIGFERLLQCMLGIGNIRDCLPFPRSYQQCQL